MPFCTRCGTQVGPTAVYCANCGARQSGVPAPEPAAKPAGGEDWLRSIAPGTAATLCYLPFVGWIAALIVLGSHRFREDRQARFHAFQGLFLFVAWLLADLAAGILFGFTGALTRRALAGTLKLSVIGGWVLMLWKTAQGETVRLPFLGDLAERSVNEQSPPRA